MTKYNVHIYREMRLTFAGIEAKNPETAAAIARDGLTSDADDIDDCDGEDLSALVDVAGDEDFRQSVTIDFEVERTRRAAPALLAIVQAVAELRRKWRSPDDAETIDSVEYMDGLDALDLDAAIANATAAGIRSTAAEINMDAVLAKRREIAVTWCIEDVRGIRPDLSEDQCWIVLENVKRKHDAEYGINWTTLAVWAEELFGCAAATVKAGEA